MSETTKRIEGLKKSIEIELGFYGENIKFVQGKIPRHRVDAIMDIISTHLHQEVIRGKKELIICAAVRADGILIRGHRHSDCIRNGLDRKPPVNFKNATQGFMTSQNMFVDRKEAMQIQKKAGIKSAWTKDGEYNGDILFSEDLY